ncbi:hypothetical protein AGABI1DRAFT_107022 [Agaricus bisporus var. burnettii JB137-S8]|uniref:Uncharacterized protein n=1 Tax=Agaricus bisporus var. burnettii (strain JB137-S8 / ATCC MYA-4627 / FGSC 10392) TaxID=597362 RepID=K5XWK2_AGABU|nr:uncharacterized protein AGABI1DRAFT_107022 [Agaricus bisporus var. burnettii JB137-S8]EKM79590.1 hypothetical protein AGABI1DRAFT_107022 [Agaricus bisporus var. burnettii JB137-S8]
MTDLQPLVLAYFKLQILSSALEAAQINHPSPGATRILQEARKAAVDEVDKFWDYFQIAESIAERYIEFLDYLSQNNVAELRHAYHTACLLAQAGTIDSRKAQQVMTNIREGMESAISRIISTLSGNKEAMSSFIDESSKVLAEIVGATDECIELLRECLEEFSKFEKEDFDEESFMRDPSWEEHQIVLQKWHVFIKSVGGLWVGWTKLKNSIRGGRRRIARSDNTPGEASREAKKDCATTNISLPDMRNPTNNANTPTGPTVSALATPPSRKAKTSFWQKTLRRIMPRLSKPFHHR